MLDRLSSRWEDTKPCIIPVTVPRPRTGTPLVRTPYMRFGRA